MYARSSAATRAAPVGVDLEHVDSKPVDAGLLGAFIVTLQPVTAQRFFYQWTALEAFWKSCGTGLADGLASLARSIGQLPVTVVGTECQLPE